MELRRTQKMSTGICILAGGLSTRMGRDKQRVRLGRRTLLGHVRRIAESLGVDVRVIRKDVVPRCGPVSGIYTALKFSRHDFELFLSCDMPFVTVELLTRMMNAKTPVFVEHDGRAGFPFMLSVAQLDAVEEEIKAARFSLQNLATALKAKRLRLRDREARQLFNLNTQADWHEAKRRAAELPL